MNYLDSEKIKTELQKSGFLFSKENPDYVIINTCAVTHTADKKSFFKARAYLKKGKKIIFTGCGARVSRDYLRKVIPDCEICPTVQDVLMFFKNIMDSSLNKGRLRGVRVQTEGNIRTRKFIEIQTGCDTYCAYCIIPFVRGKSKSRPPEEIIRDILELETQGSKEIVLTGINLAAWGASNTNKPEENRFAELLKKILEKTNIPRIRISSVGAKFLKDEFFEIFANERICDHLHISIQSGSDRILKKMNRRHGTKEIIKVAQKAKKVRKDVALTADIIVGFPGETETDFQESINLAKQLKLAKIHVFPFSERTGTLAEKLEPKVKETIKKERAEKLRKIGDELRKNFYKKYFGTKKEVLWEAKGMGVTSNFIRVKKEGVVGNTLEEVVLTEENVIW